MILCYDKDTIIKLVKIMEIVLTQNRAVGEQKKIHFIRHFLNLKGSSSQYTAISYERDILDFFQVETNRTDQT